MKACYCPKVKAAFGEEAKCEWCAVAETRLKCSKKVRGAVPIPIHVKGEAQKSAIGFVAEVLYKLATEIEAGEL